MITRPDQDTYPVTIFCDERPTGSTDGLTKREYFAAVALQGILAGRVNWSRPPAELAVEFADALISALNKREVPRG